MNLIQAELRTANPDFNIELLGVNWDPQPSFNAQMTSGRTLPWLQDTLAVPVKTSWGATYRDVRILDAQNRLQGVFNLTDNDLASEANRTTLKQLLLAAAKAADADNDRLPDDWELKHFGNLAAKAAEDFDHDGHDNFSELAFGMDPTKAESHAVIFPQMSLVASQRVMRVSFRRCAGSLLDYSLEASSDLFPWSAGTVRVTEVGLARNLFDGSGTVEVLYEMPASTAPQGFLRVRAVPRP
ncbi:MAG: hypothetical protein HYY24_15340 [Verrucomicrobia bacterium]|nr:hypothetical protein [Verrucomicrobiota bacterium]